MHKKVPFEAYKSTLSLPVLWNDMDAMQHVNNTVYFRYLEAGRIAFLRDVWGSTADMAKESGEKNIALAEVRCRFKVSLTFPDTIIIGSAIREIGEHHFMIQQEIFSEKLGFVAAEGDARLVHFDYAKKQKAVIEGELEAVLQQHMLK